MDGRKHNLYINYLNNLVQQSHYTRHIKDNVISKSQAFISSESIMIHDPRPVQNSSSSSHLNLAHFVIKQVAFPLNDAFIPYSTWTNGKVSPYIH